MVNQYLFGRPKRNGIKTKIMVAALLLAVGFGVWMNLPDEEEGSNLTVNAGTAVNGKENNNDSNSSGGAITDRKKDGNDQRTDENNVVRPEGGAYYLLKEAEGQIELYHYDIDGNERFIRVTDIPFPLISEADQESFTEGMVIETEEALDEILQDFES